jgi:hypothetical protein
MLLRSASVGGPELRFEAEVGSAVVLGALCSRHLDPLSIVSAPAYSAQRPEVFGCDIVATDGQCTLHLERCRKGRRTEMGSHWQPLGRCAPKINV